MPSVVTVPIVSLTEATPRSRLLTLNIRGTSLSFRSGQALMVADQGQGVRRPYSIASSPEGAAESQTIELLIGLDAGGSPGAHLHSMKPGTSIDIEGPVGSFTFPDDFRQRCLMFVGGGTGIAPLRSMIDHVVRTRSDEPIALLYSARHGDEFAFINELRGHASAGRLELHQTVTRGAEGWGGRRGRIGRSHFEATLHEPADTLCFVCGPAAMVDEAVSTLSDLGVPREALRTEMWSAKGQA